MLYSYINPGGQNGNSEAGKRSPGLSQPISASSSMADLAQVGGGGGRGGAKHADKEFDPFDELVAARAGFAAEVAARGPPPLAPDSSLGPLALDPLADLWPCDTPQGGPSPIKEPGGLYQDSFSSTKPAAKAHSADDWDLEGLMRMTVTSPGGSSLPPPRAAPLPVPKLAAPPPRPVSSTAGLNRAAASSLTGAATGRGHHRLQSPSVGDLLNLSDGSSPSPRHPAGSLPPALPTAPPQAPAAARAAASSPALIAPEDLAAGSSSGNGGGAAVGPSPALTAPAALEGAADPAAAGSPSEQRELLIFALPLSREKLVFLPITGWREDPKAPPAGISGSVQARINRLQEGVSSMWTNMGAKDPGTLQHRIYTHGQAVLENMSAEERLMRYIPKAATKVVVHHPACIDPEEVQEQLQKMTSTFMVKATGKAAAAGVLLPLAVGIEMIAVPGTGWFALYQLYKASVTAQGGSRLAQYLNHAKDVRVCYAGMEMLDQYVERSRLSPDGLLTQDDVDDLCHELDKPELHHPLSELRSRYIRRLQRKSGTTGDYALLPTNDVSDEASAMGGGGGQGASPSPRDRNDGGSAKRRSGLAFWK